ncbi:hypothetical protein C4S76_03195 [Apibacter adventoris]|nr:hypothetical protein C4S76_03195 [Apibacter adventoris]
MQDFFLSENYDMKIENGDFVVEDTDAQNQLLLLMSAKGDFAEYPENCVGAKRYLESADTSVLAREIDQEFTLDGMNVRKITINIPNVSVDANYKKN